MKCEYCDNPVPNGATRCSSCGAVVIGEHQSVSPLADRQQIVASENQNQSGKCLSEGRNPNLGARKLRVVYVLLGFFFGAIGLHNFYAGYQCRAVVQILISVLSFGILAILSWIWAVVEIIMINEDGTGRPFA